ncbi:Thioredoxin-like protein [Erythrobacter sp. EC-HK427]|nr:Thioredoxin-like protein [Erythrobacter sp. EC-HK427]
MAKSRLSCLACAALFAGLLSACDSGARQAAQGDDAAAGAVVLDGLLDRSFTGEPRPAVTVTDLEGQTLDLASLQEPVLVNLWATWCAPCIAEMPLLDDLAADLDGQVRVLTVSMDLRGAEVVGPFFAERQFTHLPGWMDQPNDLAMAYGGGAVLPLTILYDANGNEVWRVIGAYDWSTAEAREEVLEALSPVTPSPRVEPSGDVGPIIRENSGTFTPREASPAPASPATR